MVRLLNAHLRVVLLVIIDSCCHGRVGEEPKRWIEKNSVDRNDRCVVLLCCLYRQFGRTLLVLTRRRCNGYYHDSIYEDFPLKISPRSTVKYSARNTRATRKHEKKEIKGSIRANDAPVSHTTGDRGRVVSLGG